MTIKHRTSIFVFNKISEFGVFSIAKETASFDKTKEMSETFRWFRKKIGDSQRISPLSLTLMSCHRDYLLLILTSGCFSLNHVSFANSSSNLSLSRRIFYTIFLSVPCLCFSQIYVCQIIRAFKPVFIV